MAYQTASATSPADLLDKLRLFLLSAGWTVDNWADAGANKTLSVHRGSLYSTFTTLVTGGNATDPAPFVGVRGHTGYGVPEVAPSSIYYANDMAGPYVGYDFFEGDGESGPYVHVVVETQAGVFKHFGTGVLNKEGAYDSGQYVYASRWNYTSGQQAPSYISSPDSAYHAAPFDSRSQNTWGAVRADHDGESPAWRLGQGSANRLIVGYSSGATSTAYSAGTIGGPSRASPSALTGRTPLWPLWCLSPRPSSFYSPIGYPPDLRYVRLDNFNPKDLLTLGTDEWKVFPLIRKNGLLGEPNSGTFGYAYRVNP